MTKSIPLHGKYGAGKFALIDDADYAELSQYHWYVSNNGYAYIAPPRYKGGGKSRFMHKILLPVTKGHEVDHANGNTLDNRRCNLREVTRSQNNQNKRPRTGTSSKYKGVHWSKPHQCWVASIAKDGHTTCLGYFETQREAAEHYNQAAQKLFCEFARLNDIVQDDPDDQPVRALHKPTSKYKGVSWDKSRNLWAVEISFHKQRLFRRRFPTELEAAQERDKFIKENNLPLPLCFPD